VFFPSQPTPRGETGTAAHSARDVGRRGSIYIYKDTHRYILLYIGVIIVVSTKTNNFTPIPCVFPGS